MWQPILQTGEATIGDDVLWGTAMYRDDESGAVVFRRHPRNIGISPGHNPPLPDPGADIVAKDSFTPQEWSPTA